MKNLSLEDFKLQTPRLTLVLVSPRYRQEIFREFTPEIAVFMIPKPAKEISETDEFIAKSEAKMQRGEEVVCAILDKDTGEFFGCAGLHRINTPTPEFGIWIKKSAHGHGYGREAIAALKEWADRHLSYKYITYPCAKENAPSRKVAESLGGVLTGEEKEEEYNIGNTISVEYRIPPAQVKVSQK